MKVVNISLQNITLGEKDECEENDYKWHFKSQLYSGTLKYEFYSFIVVIQSSINLKIRNIILKALSFQHGVNKSAVRLSHMYLFCNGCKLS